MFVDFNKVFDNKTQTQIAVPPAFVDYMNKFVPEGMKYEAGPDGNCVMVGDGKSVTIGGILFALTEEQKKALGEKYTQRDVIAYFYNMQKPVPLSLMKDGYITLNGKEFSIDKISYNPLCPVEYKSGSLYMLPHPFPGPFQVEIGCEAYKRTLTVTRVAHNSVSEAAFASMEQEPLRIHLFLDSKKRTFKLDISVAVQNAHTVRDIVACIAIYNAFFDGNGTLMGKPLNLTKREKAGQRIDDNTISFWSKVLQIEELLGEKFSPSDEEVDFDTVCLVEQLFQNLMNKIPVRDKNILNSITANWEDEAQKKIQEAVGHSMFFEFEASIKFDLFGVKRSLPAVMGVCNAVLSEYKCTGKKRQIILSDEKADAPRFTATICFKSESDLKQFKSMNHNEMIKLFQSAKKAHEYL